MTTNPKTIEINDATFEHYVLHTEKPVLLEFGADWCPPCKIMIPVLEDLAVTYENRAIIARLDVDQNPITAAAYKVRNLPTMLVLKDGKVVERIVGAVPKTVLKEKLDLYL